MGFKVINNNSGIKKSNRLAKELKNFKQQLFAITSRSNDLLQNLRDIADKKSRESLGSRVREV